jgi:hypothetical protein
MSSRKSNDNSSSSGVSFPGGSSAAASTVKGVNLSQQVDPNRLLLSQGAFNGHAVEVYADGAVWDTVSNVYLFPGRDFNPQDINRR